MAATEPAGEPLGVYAGREWVGNVVRAADGYRAELPDGRAIGTYGSMREASDALSTAAARPGAPIA